MPYQAEREERERQIDREVLIEMLLSGEIPRVRLESRLDHLEPTELNGSIGRLQEQGHLQVSGETIAARDQRYAQSEPNF